jgi:elongation factor G
MLYITNGTDRLGNVTAGNTVCDYDSEEVARHFSISAAVAPVMWKDVKINIIDTPGYLDFSGEVQQALRVADSAIIVVDGKAGIEVGTELAWDSATAAGLPTAFFINKFDDNEARFGRVLDSLHETFGKNVCPLTIPMVKNGEVVGAIDLIDQTAHVFDNNGRHSVELIPEEVELVKYLADFPQTVLQAGATYSPSVIGAYVYDLAKMYNSYYHDHSILREEREEVRSFRVALSRLVSEVIGRGMNLMGIMVPERM